MSRSVYPFKVKAWFFLLFLFYSPLTANSSEHNKRQLSLDTEPIEYISSFLWSAPQDLYLKDSIAFVTFVHGLATYDVSDPTHPIQIGRVGFEGGWCWSSTVIQLLQDLLYVAYRSPTDFSGGLLMLDISNASEPIVVSNHRFEFAPSGVAISGTLALIPFRSNNTVHGLKVFDISDVQGLQEIGGVETDLQPFGISVQGQRAYLGGYGISIIDFSSPDYPKIINEYAPYSWFYASKIIPRDSLLFVAEATPMFQAPSALSILQVDDSDNLTEIGGYSLFGFISDMLIRGDTAFLSNEDRILAFDVADATSPDTISTYTTNGWATSFDLSGATMITGDIGGPRYTFKTAEFTDQDLGVIDWSDVATPNRIGTISLSAPVLETAMRGDLAYIVLSGDNRTNLVIADIGNTPTPQVISELTVQGVPSNVVLTDSLLLITGEHGLEVVDVTDPYQPIPLRSYSVEPQSLDNTRSAARSGDFVFVATNTKGFLVFNMQDTSSVPVAAIPSSNAFDLAIWGVDLYTNDGRIFDVSDPAEPVQVGTFDSGNEVCVGNGLLCIGVSGSGFKVFDVSANPASPLLLHNETGLQTKQDIYLDGHFLFVAIGMEGILRYDLTDPSNPVLAGTYDTPGAAVGVSSDDTIAVVADGYGLVKLRINVATDVSESEPLPIPEFFRLSPAYPNPFNPTTNVDLDLPIKQSVDLIIYNVLGQIVQLKSMTLTAGSHTVQLQMANVASGVYFVRVRSNVFDQTKKMILTK